MSEIGERLSKRKAPLSKSLISFALFINVGLLAIIFKQTPFLNNFLRSLTAFLGILFLAVIFTSSWKSRKRPTKIRINEVKLFVHYLRTTKKYMVASIIGMILAVLILSQAFLLPNYYEDQITEAYFGSAEYAESFVINIYPKVTGDIFAGESYTDQLNTLDQIYDASVKTLNKTITPVSFAFDDLRLFPSFNFSRIFGSNDPFKYFSPSVFPLTDRNQQYINKAFGSISDFKNNTVLIIIDPNRAKIQPSDLEILPILKYLENGTSEELVLNVTDQYVIQQNSVIRDSFSNPDVSIFLSTELFSQLVNWTGDSFFQSALHLFTPIPDADEITTLIQEIQGIENDLRQGIRISGVEISVYSSLESTLFSVLGVLESIRLTIVFLIAPIVGLGLYLMYFSSTLVERRRRMLLTIMKVRGTTEEELKLMFLTEITVGSILATIVGMGLSIPWTSISLSLSDNIETPSNMFSLPLDWFFLIPIVGFVLTFDVNIVPMFRMAGRDILEDLTPEEQKKPRWQRYNLDVIFLLIGIVDYGLLKWFPIRGPTDGIIILIIFLAPFAIFGLFLGYSLFIGRMFSPAIGKFSDLVWKRQGNLFALATRNMRQTRYTSSKLVAFTLFALMLGYVLIFLPINIAEYNRSINYYNIGADVVITDSNAFNSSIIANVSAIPEVEAISVVAKAFLDVGEYTPVLGVNHSTFADVAFWKDSFSKEDLQTLMQKLGENKSNALIHSDLSDRYQVSLNEDLILQSSTTTFDLKVVGIFESFPRLITEIYFTANFLVLNLEYLQSIPTLNLDYFLYVKLKSGINSTLALEKIDEATGTLSWASPLQETFQSTVFRSVTASVLQSSLILTTIIIAASSLFYSFITLSDRKKEIGIFRALGMKEKQIFTLLLVETLTIMAVGIILGSLGGLILNDFIVKLLFSGDLSPIKFELVIPWNKLMIFNSFVISTAIFSAAFPSRRIARMQTGSILRAE